MEEKQEIEEAFEEPLNTAYDEDTDLSLFYYQSKKFDSDDPEKRNMKDHFVYYDSPYDDITNM